MSVNRVFLIGNLGADPELRHTPGGDAVCEVSLACNERWTDKSGNKQERVEWVRVVVWRKQAEALVQYMKKGSAIYVEGRLRTEKYTDREGIERYATKVQADRVQFLGGGRGGDAGESEQTSFGGGPGGAPSNVTNFPPYGRSKGQPIHGASMQDLEFYANGARRSLADAGRANWHAKEKSLLAAIEAEIERQRRGGGGSATPAGTRAAMGAAGGGGPPDWTGGDGSAGDDDIPF